MNIWKGITHSVPYYDSSKNGQRIVTSKRPEGMSGRQWKKKLKADRKKAKPKITITV